MSGSTALTSKIVKAKDPSRYGEVLLGLHPDTSRTMRLHRRLAAIGQFAGLISYLGVLRDPVALFQGLLRPLKGAGIDDTIIAYVTRPSVTYEFDASGAERRLPAPVSSVFVVFVSFADPVVTVVRNSLTTAGRMVAGGVLDWEWTLADASIPYLPVDYQTRYRSTLWVKP
jgi:hypothetical protein